MQKQGDLLSPKALKNYTLNMNEILNDSRIKSNRSVLNNKETENDSEYVIKNYRLVYQKKKDFFLPTAHSMKQSPTRASTTLTPQESETSQVAAILSP